MLDRLVPGDVVTVTRIDRLARSTLDLFGIVKRIVDAKAQFRSLAEPWADTSTRTGRLMLAVLGGLADVERDLIRTRTAEGRTRAKAQGRRMGRPPSLSPAQQKEAIRRRAGRYVAGIGGQLRPQHIHHAPGRAGRFDPYLTVLGRGDDLCHLIVLKDVRKSSYRVIHRSSG
jgi:DNA invertase Pin-like site-specific DNA recombinase